jgi:SAM-dependent methyltransferase
MIQLSYVVPDEVLWGGEYGFYTGSSAQAVEYYRQYAQTMLAKYGRAARRGVIEIACNDGTLLQHFAAVHIPTLGWDPAAGPVAAATGKGLNVVHAPFTAATVAEYQPEPAGLVIANHVIAHVADLNDFVTALRNVLHPDGVAVVEFQYGPDLVVGNAFDHVYHEHRSFLTLSALSDILTRHDLIVVSAERTEQQRGSLRVAIEHQRTGTFPEHSVRNLIRAEDWLTEPDALTALQPTADRIRILLVEALETLRLQGKKVAGYGASAKAATLLNWCGINADDVAYVVDTTPTKWGRYIPGTDIPIISPASDSRRPDVYLLLVSNYLSHVVRKEGKFEGRWLVPIPYPVMI